MEEKNKWKRTIVVTGGAGFIGSNYLNRCVPFYPETLFVNVDMMTYAANPDNLAVSQLPNYVFEKVDIRDEEALERIFLKYRPSGVIHFAAESHVDHSIKNPHIFIDTNIRGTHNLLNLSRIHGVQRFHQVSTDEVYGSLQSDDPAFTEQTSLSPNNPYSASKASADLLVRSYHKTFGLDTVITRCSNNYGPHQDDTKLIPLFIKKLIAGEKVPLYGKGDNVRDWLYVGDHVEAIDVVFNNGKAGEIYNIGGGEEMKNIDIVKNLLELTGRDESMIEYVTDRLGHDFRYAIDAAKIKAELGWEAKTSLSDGLKKTFNARKN